MKKGVCERNFAANSKFRALKKRIFKPIFQGKGEKKNKYNFFLKKVLTNRNLYSIILFVGYGTSLRRSIQRYGGIAQLARAFGSYPKCRWFKSICRYHLSEICSCSFSYMCGPLVKRLRHRPFTAVSRVRFSHGSPVKRIPNFRNPFFCVSHFFAAISQPSTEGQNPERNFKKYPYIFKTLNRHILYTKRNVDKQDKRR